MAPFGVFAAQNSHERKIPFSSPLVMKKVFSEKKIPLAEKQISTNRLLWVTIHILNSHERLFMGRAVFVTAGDENEFSWKRAFVRSYSLFFERHEGGENAILVHLDMRDDKEREDPQGIQGTCPFRRAC